MTCLFACLFTCLILSQPPQLHLSIRVVRLYACLYACMHARQISPLPPPMCMTMRFDIRIDMCRHCGWACVPDDLAPCTQVLPILPMLRPPPLLPVVAICCGRHRHHTPLLLQVGPACGCCGRNDLTPRQSLFMVRIYVCGASLHPLQVGTGWPHASSSMPPAVPSTLRGTDKHRAH